MKNLRAMGSTSGDVWSALYLLGKVTGLKPR